MINILTNSLNVYDIIAVVAMSLPVLLAIVFSRRFNVLHGLITFLFFTSVIAYVTSFSFFDSISSNSVYFLLTGSPLTTYINSWLPFSNNHVVVAIYFVVFVISHLIASKIRRNRVLNGY